MALAEAARAQRIILLSQLRETGPHHIAELEILVRDIAPSKVKARALISIGINSIRISVKN